MAVTTTVDSVSYTASGSDTSFTFGGHFFEDTDLLVYLDEVLQVSGYSISGTKTEGAYQSGAEVVFSVAPTSGVIVFIKRSVPNTQPDPYNVNGRVTPEDVERGLDRGVVLVQQVSGQALNSPFYSAADASTGSKQILGVAQRAGKVFGWDSTGAQTVTAIPSALSDADTLQGVAAGTDTYTLTPSPALTAYSESTIYIVEFTNANTGAATLNISGLGAKAIVNSAGQALTAGMIAAGSTYLMIYDGTSFQLQRESAASSYIAPDVTAVTATATETNTNDVVTNEGSTSKPVRTLPTAVAGLEITYVVQDTDGIRIIAATGDTIRLGDKVTVSAGYIETTTVGNVVKLKAINATEWLAIFGVGTWTVETS